MFSGVVDDANDAMFDKTLSVKKNLFNINIIIRD